MELLLYRHILTDNYMSEMKICDYRHNWNLVLYV